MSWLLDPRVERVEWGWHDRSRGVEEGRSHGRKSGRWLHPGHMEPIRFMTRLQRRAFIPRWRYRRKYTLRLASRAMPPLSNASQAGRRERWTWLNADIVVLDGEQVSRLLRKCPLGLRERRTRIAGSRCSRRSRPTTAGCPRLQTKKDLLCMRLPFPAGVGAN